LITSHFPGTTGYEEAAAQGAVAGINAGLAVLQRQPLTLTRADGFLGVMIDDLIVKGAEEPCERLAAYRIQISLIILQPRPNVHFSVRI
jgi:tRNA U34 5-carboxymethylaminomethyl modifying enzyme MnmG/GidA